MIHSLADHKSPHAGGGPCPSPIASAATPLLTREARHYAIKELARRAGVSRDFFRTWTIAVSPSDTLVSLGPGSNARIRFLHGPPAGLSEGVDICMPVARAAWNFQNAWETLSPDLILPFCASDDPQRPLYEGSSDGTVICRLDLFASFLLTLSRFEEALNPQFDEHGRVSAGDSLAAQHQFLERPILDEHGLAFQQVLRALLPAWKPAERRLRLKLTHDIDDIGLPFSLSSSLAHTLKRRKPAATLRDFAAVVTSTEPAELTLVRKLAAISKQRGFESAFFWKSCARSLYDSGYDPAHPKVQRVLRDLRAQGFELGVHPGYATFNHRTKLASEVAALKTALAVDSPGGRQHYLRWSPKTWLDWESCGLSYDSSVGFADRFGFRAGTAFPYRPWSWEQNREIDLIEIPLILMDCTPVKYMRLAIEDGLSRIKALLRRVEETGGVFTLLWHNAPLMDPDYSGWYEGVLDLLQGLQNYKVPASPSELW